MYEVIHKLDATHSRDWMGRFVMYFLLFYDAGGAYRIAEENPKDYWEEVKRLAMIKETKRGTERRHFRGKNALSAIVNLQNRKNNNPWEILKNMYYGGIYTSEMPPKAPPTYTEFYHRMSTEFAGTQFGPYFIWKLYDIFNVALGMPIYLSRHEALMYMPEEPRKAAQYFFHSFEEGLDAVFAYIRYIPHPVKPHINCGYAEAETVLCMMKGAFQTRTHEIGDDIDEKWEQLRDYPELQRLLPPAVVGYAAGELIQQELSK